MITKELSEAAVELNVILENCSAEVLEKIPHNFKEFFKKIESKTYEFKYESNKSLNEQKLKPKTRRLLALIYTDYLCTKYEKEEYLKELKQFWDKEERIKHEKYNSSKIFNNERKIIKENSCNELITKQEKDTIFGKIINYIRKILKK